MEKILSLLGLVKTNHLAFAVCFIVCGLFLTTAVGKEVKTETLSGYIVCEQDDDGNVTSCKLKVTAENDDGEEVTKEYLIHADVNGKKLHKYGFKDVEVTGTVKKDKSGNMILTVKSFKEVKDEEEDNS